MKKYLLAAVAAVALIVPVALPAVASAWTTSQVAKSVTRREGSNIRAKAGLLGWKYEGITAKCAYTVQGQFSCLTTYTLRIKGVNAKYGGLVTVGPNLSITPGKISLLKTW